MSTVLTDQNKTTSQESSCRQVNMMATARSTSSTAYGGLHEVEITEQNRLLVFNRGRCSIFVGWGPALEGSGW